MANIALFVARTIGTVDYDTNHRELDTSYAGEAEGADAIRAALNFFCSMQGCDGAIVKQRFVGRHPAPRMIPG